MKPDNDNGLDKIFSKARSLQPDISRIETGLETRVLARIRAERAPRVELLDWAWRLVPAFAAVVLVLGVWYYAFTPSYTINMHAAFTAEYEDTLALNFSNGD